MKRQQWFASAGSWWVWTNPPISTRYWDRNFFMSRLPGKSSALRTLLRNGLTSFRMMSTKSSRGWRYAESIHPSIKAFLVGKHVGLLSKTEMRDSVLRSFNAILRAESCCSLAQSLVDRAMCMPDLSKDMRYGPKPWHQGEIIVGMPWNTRLNGTLYTWNKA